MKKFLYLILLLCLGIRLYENIEFYLPDVGDKMVLKIQVYHGRVSAKYGYRNFYAHLGELENGVYEGEFKILDKQDRFYTFDILSLKKKEQYFIQKYMKQCVLHLGRGRNPSFTHFLEAILLGESRTLFREERNLFQYVGLSHLLAMSGLHVSLLFLFLEKILLFCKISKPKRNIGIGVLSGIYFLGVFLSPSFFRAYIMGLCYLISGFLGEKISKCKLLFLSVWIILMWDPNQLTSLSFLLSYLAVIAIFFIVPIFQKYCEDFLEINSSYWKIASYVIYTLTIQLITTPLLMASFGSLPCLSFFANLLMLPLGTGLILMSFFTFFLEIFHLGFLCNFLLEMYYNIFFQLLEVVGGLPYLTIYLESKLSGEFVFIFYSILFLFVGIWYRSHIENKKLP